MVTLTMLESGRRGTSRGRRNPEANPKRRPTAYAQFVARYRRSHPNVPLDELFSRAADAWHGGSGSGRRNPMDNPSKKRKKGRRRNPAATAANPARHTAKRRGTRRNPFGVEKVTEKTLGVSPSELALGAANFIAVGWLGSKVAGVLGTALSRPRPADNVVDPVYAILKAAPTVAAAFLTYMGAKTAGLRGADLNAVAVSGAAAAGTELIGALHVLPPSVVTDGSIIVGHDEPVDRGFRRPLLPPPPPPPLTPLGGMVSNDNPVYVTGP